MVASSSSTLTDTILTVSAIEFYCNGAFDLDTFKKPGSKKVPPKNPVTITSDARAQLGKRATLSAS